MVFEDRKDRSQRHRIFDEKKIKKRRPESSHSDSSVEHSKYKVCCQLIHFVRVGFFPNNELQV